MAITNKDLFLREAIELNLTENKSLTLVVTGASMRPYLIGDGSEQIIVSKHRDDELIPGAIVLFLHKERHTFHRILNRRNKELIIQGDGNCIEIENIKTDEVLGIVRYIIRGQNKKISPYTLSAQLYWRVWYILRPFRKYFLFIHKKIGK